MKYVYIAAYQLLGITNPGSKVEEVLESFPDLNGEASIAFELNEHLFEIDRSVAVGRSMLKGLFGQSSEGTPEECIDQELNQIRSQRAGDSDSVVYLIYRAEGEVDNWKPRNSRECDEFSVTFEGTDKSSIKVLHQLPIQGIIAAFALGSEHMCGTIKIQDGVYFIDKSGKPTYSLDFNMSASATVSTWLKSEIVEYVKANAKLLAAHKQLVDSSRLLAKSLDKDSDKLQSFLSVWSGLEIFVNKAFKYYEAEVFENQNLPKIPAQMIQRIRDVMSDKYRIVDRFSLVSNSLAAADADSDLDAFMSIKKIRDNLMHGSDIALDSLPIARTEKLLRKYLDLHVNRIRTLL